MAQQNADREIDEWLWLRDKSRGPRTLKHLREERESYDREFVRLGDVYRRLYSESTSLVPSSEAGCRSRVSDTEYWYEFAPEAEFPFLRRSRGGHEDVILDLQDLARGSAYCRLAFGEVGPDKRIPRLRR